MTPAPDALDSQHASGPDRWWSEAWHLDAVAPDGTGLTVRLDCYPNQGVAWYWAYLVRPDLPGPLVVRDHEVPLPRQGLEVRAEGLWAELWCETPLEHWTYGLEAFGVRLDHPADALTAGEHGEIGERLPIGLDIEWEVAGPRHERPAAWPVAGVVQPGTVHGEVLVGRARFELDCRGERRHTWGVRNWSRPAWSMWGAGGELAFHVAGDAEVGTDGFVARRGVATSAVRAARTEVHRDASGLPAAARAVLDGEIEIDVDVLATAPVPLPGATLARAVCSYALDGKPAYGWAAWLGPRA